MSNATIDLAIDELGTWVMCSADETFWLTRSVLSGDRDPGLHRSPPHVVGIRQAGGRWQVYKPTTKVTARVIRHDGRPLTEEDRMALSRELESPLGDVFKDSLGGSEFDLSDGDWVVGIRTSQRWWLARLHVSGQIELVDRNATYGPVEGVATVDEGKPSGPRNQPWPRPLMGDDVEEARRFLDERGDRVKAMRRPALAYLYREFLLGMVGPQETPIADVFVALALSSVSSVSTYREQLTTRLWGDRSKRHADLRRYLLGNELLTAEDARAADDLAARLKAEGLTEATQQRLRYRSRKRPADGEG